MVAVDGGLLQVELQVQGCGRCHEPGGCGGQSLVQMSGRPKTYPVLNTIGAVVGDDVLLLIEQDLVRKAAIYAYVVPLLLCLVGALLGQFFGDIAAVLGATVGVSIGWSLIKLRSFRKADRTAHPYVQVRHL